MVSLQSLLPKHQQPKLSLGQHLCIFWKWARKKQNKQI